MKQKTQRNPFVQHVRLKRSGAHIKSKKAQRRSEKMELRKQVNQN
jgi:hypothetical protein